MNTQNYPILFENKNLNGLNFSTKEISGVNYRINNFSYKDYTSKNTKMNNKEKNSNSVNKENKNNFNVDLFKKILSDDDATSEDNYSNNFSSDEESNFNILDENENKHNNLGVFAFDNYISNKNDTQSNYKWTHFLAIPLTKSSRNLDFLEKFYYFKNKVFDEGLYNEDENIFQNPERLHLTLCMLEIKSEKEVNNLKKTLENLKPLFEEILQGEEAYLYFEALEVFGKPHDSRVMYTKPKINESNKIMDLLDVIYSNLIDKKILQKEQMKYSNIMYSENNQRYEKEKLHVTLMNTSFLNKAKDETSNSKTIPIKGFGDKLKENFNFNGMKILKKMSNFSFGTHRLNEICLYQMQIDQHTNTFKLIEKINF